jgi:hypothetical protein
MGIRKLEDYQDRGASEDVGVVACRVCADEGVAIETLTDNDGGIQIKPCIHEQHSWCHIGRLTERSREGSDLSLRVYQIGVCLGSSSAARSGSTHRTLRILLRYLVATFRICYISPVIRHLVFCTQYLYDSCTYFLYIYQTFHGVLRARFEMSHS